MACSDWEAEWLRWKVASGHMSIEENWATLICDLIVLCGDVLPLICIAVGVLCSVDSP